jgi:endonuclease V-like protein UPF0215 family
MQPAAGVWVQCAGMSIAEAEAAVRKFTLHGNIPEPLRIAHLIASGVATGQSRGRT